MSTSQPQTRSTAWKTWNQTLNTECLSVQRGRRDQRAHLWEFQHGYEGLQTTYTVCWEFLTKMNSNQCFNDAVMVFCVPQVWMPPLTSKLLIRLTAASHWNGKTAAHPSTDTVSNTARSQEELMVKTCSLEELETRHGPRLQVKPCCCYWAKS